MAGAAIAAEAAPVSERAGTVTFACRSAVWASELDLLAPDLLERLNAALGEAERAPVKALRFRVGGAGLSGPRARFRNVRKPRRRSTVAFVPFCRHFVTL